MLSSSIGSVQDEEYEAIASSGDFVFDWRLERYSEVYKLTLNEGSKSLLGLVSLEEYNNQQRLNINLLEVAKANRGRHKMIGGVAGCLIAYTAALAFERGYGGLVTLEPKSALIQHYEKTYGFVEAGHLMYLPTLQAHELIQKYLEHE